MRIDDCNYEKHAESILDIFDEAIENSNYKIHFN